MSSGDQQRLAFRWGILRPENLADVHEALRQARARYDPDTPALIFRDAAAYLRALPPGASPWRSPEATARVAAKLEERAAMYGQFSPDAQRGMADGTLQLLLARGLLAEARRPKSA
jgi:hypothetical protein